MTDRKDPDKARVGQLVQLWREQRRPAEVPNIEQLQRLPRTPGSRPREKKHLSQQDVARLAGVSDRWYRALEQGSDVSFSAVFLQEVADVLGLSWEQTVTLFAVHGHAPPHRAATDEVDPATRRLLHDLPHAAYISNRAWDVLDWNERAAAYCPWVHTPNVMTWALSPDAQQWLDQWEEAWARPLVAQMRVVVVRHPEDEHLQEVAAAVRQYPPIDRLWQADDLALVHPYGDRRPMWIPDLSTTHPTTVELAPLAPLRDETQRLMVLMPVTDALAADG